MTEKACEGATPLLTDWDEMAECRECGTRVRRDLVEHSFFGFKAGCKEFVPADERSLTM